jgi:RsiW-degrading membrane proteinase PrsW (M82 family)
MAILRWLATALLPAVGFAVLMWRVDKRREPPWLVGLTFALGAVSSAVAFFIVRKAAQFTGLDVQTSLAGNTGALLFVFALAAPVREAAKVAACWMAFRSRYFDEPIDGIVYASAAALGFATVDSALTLHLHPVGSEWIVRVILELFAQVFFACTWGYGLGRAKQSRRPGAVFPAAWTLATAAHGLYLHLAFGRSRGAMLGILPLLAAMGIVAFFAGRDLIQRGDRASRLPMSPLGNRLSRMSRSYVSAPPSLAAVRAALRKNDQPIKIRWIAFGALVTIGAMLVGLTISTLAAHWLDIDFAYVDERSVSTIGPIAVLGAGLLAAFPISGYLVAKASSASTLLEPALAAALALTITIVIVGFAAPVIVVFGLACSPIAWTLSCMGAWVGRATP